MTHDTKQSPIPERWQARYEDCLGPEIWYSADEMAGILQELGTAEAKITALEAQLSKLSDDRVKAALQKAKEDTHSIRQAESGDPYNCVDCGRPQQFCKCRGRGPCDELQEKLTALEAERDLRNSHIRGLGTRNEQLQASSQMLQIKLDAATEGRDKWLGEHNRLQRDLRKAREHIKDLSGAITKAECLQEDLKVEWAKVEQLSQALRGYHIRCHFCENGDPCRIGKLLADAALQHQVTTLKEKQK